MEDLREPLMQLLGQSFRPEFLNRIDEVIIFHGLDRAQLRQITTLLLEETRRRLRAQDITLNIDDEAMDWLANVGFQPEFGARPLRRTIQRELDNQLSRLLLGGEISSGDTVTVTVQNGRLHLANSPDVAQEADPSAGQGNGPEPTAPDETVARQT